MARAKVSRLSCSRTANIALVVLPSTFTPNSSMLSAPVTWVCVSGTVADRPDARRSLKSLSPSQPSVRQKRITVGWLTCAARAISAIGSPRAERGCASTWSATRLSAGDRLSRERLICPRMAGPWSARSARNCVARMADAPTKVACSAVMT